MKIMRTIAAISAAALLLGIFIGCGSDSVEDINLSENEHISEIVQFPELDDDMRSVDNIILVGDVLYFTSNVLKIIELGGDHESRTGIENVFSMDISETERISILSFTPLPNFEPPAPPPDTFIGWHLINAMQSDNDGNLWLFESGSFAAFDFPEDFDIEQADEEAVWEYFRVADRYNIVRKLDNTGTELLSLCVDMIIRERLPISSRLGVDTENNLYLGFEGTISVIDQSGRLLFELSVPGGYVDRLLRMPSGNIAFPEMTGEGIRLSEIDITNRTLGRTTQLPLGASMPFTGTDEFPIVYSDGINLIAYNPDTGETVSILNWVSSGVSPESVIALSLLENERIMLTTERWRGGYTEQDIEIAFLSWTNHEAPPDDRIPLTLSTLYLDRITREAVMAFNRASNTHHIQVIDYSEFNTGDDYTIGLTRLTLDLITGNVPDLLDVSSLPLQRYAAIGLLEDLYPFLDADPELGRGDLIESILKATEINGAIYRLFPAFGVNTIIGNPSVVGSYPGWDIDEFTAVLNANTHADIPLGQSYTRILFLSDMLYFNMSDYVDWESAVVHFDSDNFISLLQAVAMLPLDESVGGAHISRLEIIATGRQIMMPTYLGSFFNYQFNRALFGGDIVFKGYPAENRDGNTLSVQGGIAITTASENKDAAWEFIRFFLTADFARNYVDFSFPLNKVVFNELLDEAMMEPEAIHQAGFDDFMIDLVALTQQEADQILDLFDRVSDVGGWELDLFNIIIEGASDFFNGRVSAHDAARIIQNRASIFMAEQAR